MSRSVRPAFDIVCEFGEGPVWDPRGDGLWWLDLARPGLIHGAWATGETRRVDLPVMVGSIAPRRGGGFLAAVPDGFAELGADGRLGESQTPPGLTAPARMNDGGVAPDGSFWAGTAGHPDGVAGALYRIDKRRRITTILDDVTTSNGVGWLPGDEAVYYVDTARQALDLLRPAGTGYRRETVLSFDRGLGVPDGLAVDAEGCAWVAMCFGGRVLRCTPAGEIVDEIVVPASLTTSVAFGGEGLAELFITTGREGLDPEQLADTPDAGRVFVVRPGVAGSGVGYYAG